MYSRPPGPYPQRAVSYEPEKNFPKTEIHTRIGRDMKLLERLLSIEATNKPLLTRRKSERKRRYGVWSYSKPNAAPSDSSAIDSADDRQWTRRETQTDGHERRRWNSGGQTSVPLDLHQHYMKFTPKHSQANAYVESREKPLRLPPVLLPPIYTVKPAPLHPRLLLTPTYHRGPIRDSEWEDLKECRYLRQGLSKFKNVNQPVV